MRVPIEWLKEFIDLPLEAEALAESLTMAGLEVEAVETSEIGPVLEIAITPNRGDCLSIVGLALELSALLKQPAKEKSPPKAARATEGKASVKIKAPQLCTRYCGQIMEGVKLKESPQWMQQRLEACGVRAINNVVDITNYVMLEQGQPLHAFDLDRLSGGGVIVRRAKVGEVLVTLDGKDRRLNRDDLVIADKEGPVALAGVMGGLNTEVHEGTTRLFLESACFDPGYVRRTSKRLGLQSESSYRFERGVDWERVRTAMERMKELLQEHAEARPVGKLTDAFAKRPVANKIAFEPEQVALTLGGQWKQRDIETPLKQLGCVVQKKSAGSWTVTVPLRRHDLAIPVDLIEEVARLNGYESIAEEAPRREMRLAPSSKNATDDRNVNQTLMAQGFAECIHYSFCSQDELERLGSRWLPLAPELSNPLSEDTAYLRPTLLGSLLRTVHYHQSRQMFDLRFFESRSSFQNEANRFEERRLLSGILCGEGQPAHWSQKRRMADFFDGKGVIQSILRVLGPIELTWDKLESGNPYADVFHPKRSAQLNIDGRPVGVVGELHPEREEAFELKGPIYLFELDWQDLTQLQRSQNRYESIPSVPWVQRDLAIVVDEEVPAESVYQIIKGEDEGIVSNILIFDVYMGDQIPTGKKSLAFSYQVGRSDRTLTDAEVEALQQKIVTSLKNKLQADIR